MTDHIMRMPSPDDISDADFQKAVSDALDEHDKRGLPRSDIPKSFGMSKPTFERWAQGTWTFPAQPIRKGILEEIEKWRQKQKGLRD